MMTRKEWNDWAEILVANRDTIKEMYMENQLFEFEEYETYEEYVRSNITKL
jgi:hypothetical protein